MSARLFIFSYFALLLFTRATVAQNIVEDQGVGMSREELEFIVKYWTPQMQEAAATDSGDRIELINLALSAKKIASEAQKLSPEVDGELYWKHMMLIRNTEKRFMLDTYMSSLEVPDMAALAQERYLTEKDKYALVPEQRLSSQILVLCQATTDCDRKEKRLLAEKILADLQDGQNFEELVETYSEDPGSKPRQGRFNKWLGKGEPRILPQYLAGVFNISEEGGYSGVVESEVGFHIIRLDGIRKPHYRTFEEAKPEIVQALEKEYRVLAAKEFDSRYRLTDKAYMDTNALDEIFDKYRSSEPDSLTRMSGAGE